MQRPPGVAVEDALALGLRVAAADGDDALGVDSVSCDRVPEVGREPVSGFSRIVQVLKTTTSASSGEGASPSPSSSSMPLIRSESWAFI